MASIRGLAEVSSDWGGCGRDAFELDVPSEAPAGRLTGRPKNQGLITRTIEKQIIPHLLQAHRSTGLRYFQNSRQVNYPSSQEIIDFAHLLIAHDVAVASDFVENMCRNGSSLEVIFLDLFAPAAKYIGRMWNEDKCNFADVTIALSRLQQLLRELGGAFEAEGAVAPCGRSALLVGAPGEQHTFGVFVVQEFFRRAGWDVHGGGLGSSDELFGLVAGQAFDVIGLSVSNTADVGDLAALVRTVREAARPHAPMIMVGGQFFLECPQCIGEVGADATAQDGRRAILGVSSLLPAKVLG